MADYFIAVKAQNLRASMFDTEDLSTIRGASFLRIEAIRGLTAGFAELEPITVGVAFGVWQFAARSDPDAKDVVERIEAHLVACERSVLTFGVACVRADAFANFRDCKRALIARLQRSQLSAANVAYPVATGETCPVDLVRPVAADEIWVGGERKAVSHAVYVRRKAGVDQKQKYAAELIDGSVLSDAFGTTVAEVKRAPFALLLSSISEGAEPPAGLKPNLYDKIAVIHMDGNGFGALQDRCLATNDFPNGIQAQKDFDERLEANRKTLIAAIVECLDVGKAAGKPSPDEKALRDDRNTPPSTTDFRTDTIIRFEALLWGGDDLTIIVPARLGWTVAQTIVETMNSPSWMFGDRAMRSAIGLVFCHHDAPIARIRTLADRLLTHLKHTTSTWSGEPRAGRDHTLLFPLVLESFDHIGEGLDDYLNKRVTPDLRNPDDAIRKARRNAFFALDAADMCELQALAKARDGDPEASRGRLRKLAQAAHHGKLATMNEDETLARQWMLLEDLWDYLVPLETDAGAVS